MKDQSMNEATEAALALLARRGLDVSALRAQMPVERTEPTADDVRYELPTEAPKVEDHFQDGVPQVLMVATMWEGYSYSLTTAQRAILRETFGMTPSQTVTVRLVERWPGTRFPRSVKLTSDLHVDPRLRKHVLTSVHLREVGKFFREAAEREAAEQTTPSAGGLSESALTVGRFTVLSTEDRWAVADITGVKLTKDVEVQEVGDERFVLSDSEGRVAKVPRREFFETVAEYERLYASDHAPKGRKGTGATALSKVLDDIFSI